MSTYKRPDLLFEQLNCILAQTYQHIEVVISDNDTDQSGRPVVEKINDPRIKYFPNPTNLGMVASFNASIERSKGSYVVMITDDDPAYPHMLSDLIMLLNLHPGYGVYGGCGDWLIQNEFAAKTLDLPLGKTTHLLKSMQENEVTVMEEQAFAESYLDGFFSTTFLLWSCLMVERSILLNIKGMPNYGSELLTDHAYVIAAGSQKGMVYINKAMGGQVVHGDNFGYDIFKLKDKYIHTPQWFFNYLEQQLSQQAHWNSLASKIWDFAGRAWVEYTLLIARAITDHKQKKAFYELFNEAFKNKNIHKWKYKFYLKYNFRPLFNLLLSVKKLWK